MDGMKDVSKHFRPNKYDTVVAQRLAALDKTPQAIEYFEKVCGGLTDYGYWFLLSTLWVSYTGWSDISVWKHLFDSKRPLKYGSIMKPSEHEVFGSLPNRITVYRAHRPNEEDWIAYTMDVRIAARFARERGVTTISEYRVRKQDVTALFLRRGEQEIIMLDKKKVRFQREIEVVVVPEELLPEIIVGEKSY